jgi:hypothetical protein
METSNIELTPEQKGVLASLSEETGEPISALIDQVLHELQERVRAARENEGAESHEEASQQLTGKRLSPEADKPIWEKFIEASQEIPDEELDRLPTDLASQVDHYIYGTPKR